MPQRPNSPSLELQLASNTLTLKWPRWGSLDILEKAQLDKTHCQNSNPEKINIPGRKVDIKTLPKTTALA